MKGLRLQDLLRRVSGGSFSVTFWDGRSEHYGPGEAQFHVHFRKPLPLARLIRHPELVLGEAYMNGSIDVDGDLRQLMALLQHNMHALDDLRQLTFGHRVLRATSSVFSRLERRLPGQLRRALARQRRDVQSHYDLGNDFFSLWLDETLSYSCAYFEEGTDPLEQAQVQKIDHVLRKLQLKPKERLLDIGSGWGWLIIRAAQQYGVEATGITLSEKQAKATEERIRQLGLQGQVSVHLMDYRELGHHPQTKGAFDKIASVGMFEHVGQDNIDTFLRAVQSALKPRGLMLLHTITGPVEEPLNPWIGRYIFPGGYIPSLREVIWRLPELDFHTLDIESLRLHYAYTLDRWAERFEQCVDVVRERYGERFVRMWRLYLLSCAQSFRISGLNIYQILFSKGLNNELPLTRRHLYEEKAATVAVGEPLRQSAVRSPVASASLEPVDRLPENDPYPRTIP